jgi:CheY-like chemotaxis protein
MPGIGGVEVFRRIKEISPDTFVVMMTGLPADNFINETVHEGAYTVLYKPIDTHHILSLVQSLSGSPCVLVVENEPESRELLRMVFEDGGTRCAEALDGSQAVSKIANGQFDVVMVDIKIPGTSIIESCQEILSVKPDTKIVFITDYQIDQSAKHALSAGAFSLLTKPVDPVLMLSLVGSLMEETQLDSSRLSNGSAAD